MKKRNTIYIYSDFHLSILVIERSTFSCFIISVSVCSIDGGGVFLLLVESPWHECVIVVTELFSLSEMDQHRFKYVNISQW